MGQKINVPMVQCANCHYATPRLNRLCVHCGKPRDVAVPVAIVTSESYKKPTPADRAAYQEWLIKKATA